MNDESTVTISKLALTALACAAVEHVRRGGYYENRNGFGKIEIADALKQGSQALGYAYDVKGRSMILLGCETNI